jgi:hypothetical protein
MSIYVPDELKERMDDADSVNWSGVAQSAFEKVLRLHPKLTENEMQATIERLKASKTAQTDDVIAAGVEAGKKWAMEKASYLDLATAGKELTSYKTNAMRVFPERLPTGEKFFKIALESGVTGPDKYFEHGFCLGVIEVWKQVKDHLA